MFCGNPPLQALASVLHLNFSTCAGNAEKLQHIPLAKREGLKGNLIVRVREESEKVGTHSGSSTRVISEREVAVIDLRVDGK